jgi:hypothetical protein
MNTTVVFPIKAVAITPSDTTILDACAIYVGVGGDVAVMPAGGTSAVTFKNAPAGSVIPLTVVKVMSTNTTATNMVGVYNSR